MIIPKNRAFTLIELLVVVAIICILAALAMPSFRTAQETSRTSKCSNNLRQIGAAMELFANDHNNSYPESGAVIPWNATDPTTNQQSWMQQLGPYIGNPPDPQSSPNGTVFTCPSSSQSVKADKYYSYFNGAHAGWAYMAQNGSGGSYAAVKKTLLEHPTEYILSGDITDWSDSGMVDADKDNYNQNPIDTMATFHNSFCNLLFGDGHVESIKWNTSLTPAGYFDQTRMTTHYEGTGATATTYYTFLNP